MPATAQPLKTVTAKLDQETLYCLKAAAAAQKTNASELVRHLVEAYLQQLHEADGSGQEVSD